jgi:hypothetical protein
VFVHQNITIIFGKNGEFEGEISNGSKTSSESPVTDKNRRAKGMKDIYIAGNIRCNYFSVVKTSGARQVSARLHTTICLIIMLTVPGLPLLAKPYTDFC